MPDTAPAYPTLSADRIPEYSGYEIARFFIKDMRKRLFSDPKEMKQYDAWQAELDARRAAEQNNGE